MSAADSTTYSAALKRLYPEKEITRQTYEIAGSCYAMMPKKYDAFGESWHIGIRYAVTGGRSATFQNAKNNKVASAIDKWLVTPVQDYSLYSVAGLLARQSSNQKGALVDALQEEVDSAMEAMGRSLADGVYGDGSGIIGTMTSASNVATATITLADVNTVIKFMKNQSLNLVSSGGVLRSGKVTVKAIDRDAGTITINEASWSAAISGAANTDSIVTDGDYNAKMKGIQAWLPATAPAVGGGDSFFGMDRSKDPTWLAGNRVDGRGRLIEEAIKLALQRTFRNGGKVSHIFMNDANFLDLDLSLGSRRLYVDTDVAGVGFTGIKYMSAVRGMKPVEIYPDPWCPYNTAFGLTMSDWSLRGPGMFPFIEERDGQRILREDTADAFEGRIVSYHQAVCVAPGRSFRLQLG